MKVEINTEGYLRKMSHVLEKDSAVTYYLRFAKDNTSGIGEKSKARKEEYSKKQELKLNDFLGQRIKLEFKAEISCIGCARSIKKTFNQGYCFPCLQKLAECDTCIIKPEQCHYDEGTCRDPEWGDKHCNIKHSIYLSLTSGAKIGITRQHQESSRWIDQGAIEALRIATVARRKTAGLIEVQISKHIADKTNWRKMLKNEVPEVDLLELRSEIFKDINSGDNDLSDYFKKSSDNFLEEDTEVLKIKYPVLEYPEKISSHNFDKNPVVEGLLQGIKGQYLILDTGVINLRKFAGYKVSFSTKQ